LRFDFEISLRGRYVVKRDAQHVAALRAAGAILLGKANMHEAGIGVTGWNTHHRPPRNPYRPSHHTGGSSSGCAALVASGICPVTIGCDGGGSIRIPSSFCGVYGLVGRPSPEKRSMIHVS
jgi:Asp-tRNA(Asn)/Glu-tRNA(Gln) amidotransferase A subunit family amidase